MTAQDVTAALVAHFGGLDHVFAVLDGAQFDNLPQSLVLSDLNSRALYLDRGDNAGDQVVTAPQLVAADTAPALDEVLALVGDAPRAVFWKCPRGGDVLYRHLRGINMIEIPASSLSRDDQAHVREDWIQVLFRHADANAMAQVFVALADAEAARVMGPAEGIVFFPDSHWAGEYPYLCFERAAHWPAPRPGLPRLSPETMDLIAALRTNGLRNWARRDFAAGAMPMSGTEVEAAYARAGQFGFEQKDDIWAFIALERDHGPGFETRRGYEEVALVLNDRTQTAAQRIYYAAEECESAVRGMDGNGM